jgi:hypothetical protein
MKTVVKLPSSLSTTDSRQYELDLLHCSDGTRINDLGMGVFNDGTPFLTQRGLATLCGVQNAHIGSIGVQWNDEVELPRIRKIRSILDDRGETVAEPYTKLTISGKAVYAYGEAFSLAVLEYYAFEAEQFCRPEALKHFRMLAGGGLRHLIYKNLGYDPNSTYDKRWQPYLDRVSSTHGSVPEGYFSIFREIADLVVLLGENDVFTDSGIIPDISVGLAWANHWHDQKLFEVFGDRGKYLHNYPSYFPQAASNPQSPSCYPEAALPVFRRWFREGYLRGGKFSSYLRGQVRSQKLSLPAMQKAIKACIPTALE